MRESQEQRSERQRSERRCRLLAAGIELAEAGNLYALRRTDVIRRAGFNSRSNINNAFGSRDAFLGEVLREAIRVRNLKVIAQGIVAGDAITAEVPATLRAEAIQALI